MAPMSATVQEVWQGFHYTVSHIDGASTEGAGVTVAGLAGLDGKQNWTLDRLVRDGWAARTPHGVIDLGSGFAAATMFDVDASGVSLLASASVRDWPHFRGLPVRGTKPVQHTICVLMRFTCADLTSTETTGRTVDFDPSAPWWRGISPGISLSGRCHTPSCQAHNQLVYSTVCKTHTAGPEKVGVYRLLESTTFPSPPVVSPSTRIASSSCTTAPTMSSAPRPPASRHPLPVGGRISRMTSPDSSTRGLRTPHRRLGRSLRSWCVTWSAWGMSIAASYATSTWWTARRCEMGRCTCTSPAVKCFRGCTVPDDARA